MSKDKEVDREDYSKENDPDESREYGENMCCPMNMYGCPYMMQGMYMQTPMMGRDEEDEDMRNPMPGRPYYRPHYHPYYPYPYHPYYHPYFGHPYMHRPRPWMYK